MSDSITSHHSIDVEPYVFSLHDARATIAEALDFVDLAPAAAADQLTTRRGDIGDSVDSVDAWSATADVIEDRLRVVWPLIRGIRHDVAAAGALPASATGAVEHIALSGGGAPKAPVESATVGFGGLAGDRQATRRHHGRPYQAVCLWSADVLDDLAAAGHPVSPGGVGENVLIRGLDWREVTLPARLQLGSALVEITCPATPCRNIAFNFTDRDFNTISADRGPISRLYALVIEPGEVATGDPVILEP